MRQCIEGVVKVRMLEPFEQMRLQGWMDELWRRPSDFYRERDGYELVSDIAGNAFSFWNYGPWSLAIYATYGYWSAETNWGKVPESHRKPDPEESGSKSSGELESVSSSSW